MAHATNDIQQVRMASGMGLVALNDALFLGSAAIGFMVYINLELTLYVLIPMPLIVWAPGFSAGGCTGATNGCRVPSANSPKPSGNGSPVSASSWPTMPRKPRPVRLTGYPAYVNENIDLVKITGAFFPLMLLLTNLSLAIVLFQGGRQTIFSRITPGDFVAFISYLGLLTWPMMALGWVTNLIQRGRASLDRLDGIFKTHSERWPKPSTPFPFPGSAGT
jgi:ATP-binding cassette subfamily B multidrug efflux pump